MKAFAAVLLLLSVTALTAADDVKVLTTDNFDDWVNDQELTVVEFYAPWCGHCKSLEPQWADAATKLLKSDPPVHLAKVDATENQELASRFGVSGYPTIKVFRNGNPADYNGPRESAGIVSYVRKQAGPSSKEITSVDEYNTFKASDDAIVFGLFTSMLSDEAKTFLALADSLRESYRFGHTTEPSVLNDLGRRNVVAIAKKYADEPEFLRADDGLSQSDLEKFIQDHSIPLAGTFSEDTAARYQRQGLPVALLYVDVDWEYNAKQMTYYSNRLKKAAKEFLGKVNFALADKNERGYDLDKLGWTDIIGTHDVKLAIMDLEKDARYKMPSEFSAPNLIAFAGEFVAGNVKPSLKSEPIPADNDGPVTVLVADQFDELVMQNDKDVLIEFYAPWCGHCKSLEPKYNELGEKFADVDSMVIAKMDATANDAPPQFNVRGFPTIYFVPGNDKSNPKQYEGGREVKDFVKYLKKEAANEFEL